MIETEVLIIGGGIIGAAVGYGLSQQGVCPTVIDEAHHLHRASVGNFGLVWVQGKAVGNPDYAKWTLSAARKYPSFSEKLADHTGIDIHYQQTGGLALCLSEAELAEKAAAMDSLARETGDNGYTYAMLEPEKIQQLIPDLKLGTAVIGASFTPHDGHSDPLLLLKALLVGLQEAGGKLISGCPVHLIEPAEKGYRVETAQGPYIAGKVVIAAGNGIPRLVDNLGLKVPVRPQRGQLLVTERVSPALRLPLSGIRQADNGTFLLGYSQEEVGFQTHTTLSELKRIAYRAIRCFPELAGIRVIRSWAALRVLTPDVAPIYEQPEDHPGLFVVTSHSGVTLASLHADEIARWIVSGGQTDVGTAFRLRRFDVQETASK